MILNREMNRCPARRASLIAQLVKNPPAMQETPVGFLGQEDLLEKEMITHCSILAMDRGAWQATVHRVSRVGHDLVTKSPTSRGLGD